MRLDQAVVLNPGPPPGVVAITADETGRFTRFALSMQGLQIPGGPASRTIWQVGSDVAGNRNEAVDAMLAMPEARWIWFIDDDHSFPGDILMRLLDRNVDIVQPLCLRRLQPFLPVATGLDGNFLNVHEYRHDQLAEVMAAGSSGMLIRREVLEAVEKPWFELGYDDEGRRVSEDVWFCQKARAAGFPVHVDMGARIGHLTVTIVVPAWDSEGERWLTGFSIADGAQLAVDPAPVAPADPEEGLDAELATL